MLHTKAIDSYRNELKQQTNYNQWITDRRWVIADQDVKQQPETSLLHCNSDQSTSTVHTTERKLLPIEQDP